MEHEIREVLSKKKNETLELPDYGVELTALFKNKPNTPEVWEQITTHLEAELRKVEDFGYGRVDHEAKKVFLQEFMYLQVVVPNLKQNERYEVYLQGNLVGHVTYKGVEFIGSRINYNYDYEPKQQLKYVVVEVKLD